MRSWRRLAPLGAIVGLLFVWPKVRWTEDEVFVRNLREVGFIKSESMRFEEWERGFLGVHFRLMDDENSIPVWAMFVPRFFLNESQAISATRVDELNNAVFARRVQHPNH